MRIARMFAIVVLLAILATAAFAAESRAVIATMKGKVKIKKPGKTAWETPKHFAALPQGTLVRTEKNSEVTLHLSTGEVLHIGPGQTAEVPGEGKASSIWTKVLSLPSTVSSAFRKKLDGSREVVYSEEGGTRNYALDMFEVLEESRVLPGETVLGWEDSKAGSYELFLFLKDRSIVTSENYRRFQSISHKSVSGLEAKLGAQDGLAAGGSYYAVIMPAGRRAKVARIHVVPEDEAKSILEEVEKLKSTAASDDAILHVLLGSLYEEKELFFDALREYRIAERMDPDVGLSCLADLYVNLGLVEVGNSYLKKRTRLEKK